MHACMHAALRLAACACRAYRAYMRCCPKACYTNALNMQILINHWPHKRDPVAAAAAFLLVCVAGVAGGYVHGWLELTQQSVQFMHCFCLQNSAMMGLILMKHWLILGLENCAVAKSTFSTCPEFLK